MDEEHVKNLNYNRRNRPATHITSCLISGASNLGLSILGAIAGIIEQPLQGMQQTDDSSGMIAARGLVVGLGKGLLGVVTKPVGGAMEFVSQTSHGIMHSTGLTTMLKRQVADLEHCGRDQSSMKSTTTKYIWKWEFPKDIDANSAKTVLTLVSRQLFIDVSPASKEFRPTCKWLLKVQTYRPANGS